MLCSIRDLQGYAIDATDGSIGSVHEMLFDDVKWVIRYLVIDTGKWLPGRRVLISPVSVASVNSATRVLALRLDRDRIRNSPDIDTDKPVSRQKEASFHSYYGYGPYWVGPGLWGLAPYPQALAGPSLVHRDTSAPTKDAPHETGPGDPHLRSSREVIGYQIAGSDIECGHLDDFILDDGLWTIRHLVVDISNWPGRRTVLLSPLAVREIDWILNKIHLDGPAERVCNAPEYSATLRR